MGGPQSQSGHFGERGKSFIATEIQTLDSPATGLVTIPTTLLRLKVSRPSCLGNGYVKHILVSCPGKWKWGMQFWYVYGWI
jgi:hypothetical protein